MVQGAKLRVWVKRWWREVWSRERNYGPGSSAGGGKCGPWGEIMVLGQALMAGSVVQGAKPCPWVKPVPARVWSEERNYGLWSNAGGGKCGPGSQTAALVKPVPARVWSREQNCGPGHPCPARVWSREQNRAPGSPPAPPKHGLGSKTVPPGHPVPARAWSSHLKYKKESKTNI